MACLGRFVKQRIGTPRQSLGYKTIIKAQDQSECLEFEMVSQHKSILCVYKELRWEIGFEEYLEYVKEGPSSFFLTFRSGTHGLYNELGKHAKRDGSHDSFGM